MNSQAAAEKSCKNLESQLNELTAKVDESNRTIAELNNQKSRAANEGSDLARQLEEAESQVAQLTRSKQQVDSQMEELKRTLEDETRVISAITQINLIIQNPE